MYRTILLPIENSAADQTMLDHIKALARPARSNLILLHVADGWVARNFDQLNLAESEEIQEDRAYLERRAAELRDEGFSVECVLAMGQPSDEIIKYVQGRPVDLIAMATHGHRLVGDLIHGSTADKVRHLVDVPVLLLKAKM
jgi:nucleotide-binding universal stress UspA family protein